MREDALKFFLGGMVVGYFQESSAPRCPGRYRYMAYRGPGHYVMWQRLQSGERPRCELKTRHLRISFSVLGIAEAHVIEIGDVDVQPRESPAAAPA